MIGVGNELPVRSKIAAQFVGDHHTRLAELCNEPCQKALCRFGISAGLHQDVERVAIGIHGPPQPVFPATDRNDHLLQMPSARRRWPLSQDAGGEILAKTVDPKPDAPRLTIPPRSAKMSSTSAVLRAKRCQAQTA